MNYSDFFNKYISFGLYAMTMVFVVNYFYTKNQTEKETEYHAQRAIVTNKLEKIARESRILEKAMSNYALDTAKINILLASKLSKKQLKKKEEAKEQLISKSKELYIQIENYQNEIEEAKTLEVGLVSIKQQINAEKESLDNISLWLLLIRIIASISIGFGVYKWVQNNVDYFEMLYMKYFKSTSSG